MEVKRYDCNKTADFAHEVKRMCEQYIGDYCYSCPLRGVGCGIDHIDGDTIASVQKWSDENPEKPKLTKEEYIFLQGFMHPECKSILRNSKTLLRLKTINNDDIWLNPNMFSFIKLGETWWFTDLLKLEVKEN
jgi:hypothetical protein